jgi:GTP pyrophosphokinase
MVVSVQHSTALPAESGDFQPWLESLSAHYPAEDIEGIRAACELAAPLYEGRTELTGTPLIKHALGAAAILAGLNMDADTLKATILHGVPSYLADWREKVEGRFGKAVANLVDGISQMERIQEFSELETLHESGGRGDPAQQIESLRKMLLAMAEDIRVVLIKLAERTQTLRNLSGASEELQRQIARETEGIYAPLANRLGVWQIKWEMEDLALRYQEPKLYKDIAKRLDERRVDREQYIADVVAQLKDELARAGIKGEVNGRPKHIFSIINKMRRKRLEFNQLYDVRGVRILVDDIKDCYTVLGLIHSLWQPIPGEFDDYIARPKSNNYRSLHTAVTGPKGLALEVQIRTHEMHQHSELGVAAHWRYKEGGKSDSSFDDKIAWLRQLLAWKDEVAEQGDMLEQFRSELFQDKVFVLTPQGKVIDLPKGATPLDFAYTLHTDLGHRTRGAKVDGSIVPLNYQLQNGQRVEILTSKIGAPSRDWLLPKLGYLQSPRARAKVRHWFKQQNFDEDVATGRNKLERELHRLHAHDVSHEKLAQKLSFNKLEDMLAAIGRGDVSDQHLATMIQEEIAPRPDPVRYQEPVRTPIAGATGKVKVVVEGVRGLLINYAKCCIPEPGDNIVAYMTRDRGVTIHRIKCNFVQRLPEERRARLLAAQWEAGKK